MTDGDDEDDDNLRITRDDDILMTSFLALDRYTRYFITQYICTTDRLEAGPRAEIPITYK